MDRLPRKLAACSLGLMLFAPGCKTTKPEVPAGRPYANDGAQRKAIDFSSEGHPTNGAATANLSPNMGLRNGSSPAAEVDAGLGRPDASAYGVPGGSFGPPGTSGLAPRNLDPAAEPASMAPPAGMPGAMTTPGASAPAGTQPAPMPPLGATPTRDSDLPVPNQVMQGGPAALGRMGTPDQMPSPN